MAAAQISSLSMRGGPSSWSGVWAGGSQWEPERMLEKGRAQRLMVLLAQVSHEEEPALHICVQQTGSQCPAQGVRYTTHIHTWTHTCHHSNTDSDTQQTNMDRYRHNMLHNSTRGCL